jgi:hypothetical protein
LRDVLHAVRIHRARPISLPVGQMLAMSSLLIQIAIAAGIFLAGCALGIKWQVGVVAARDLKTVQDNARVQILRADKADQAAERHEKAKASIEIRYQTIEKEVQHVVEKPVYRNVCLDGDGLRVLRAALAGPADAASQPARAVSGPVGP